MRSFLHRPDDRARPRPSLLARLLLAPAAATLVFGLCSPAAAVDSSGTSSASAFPKPVPTPLPVITELKTIYPMPMSKRAIVTFSLAREQSVDVSIYDVRGARVRTLVAGSLGAGVYEHRWGGRDGAGRFVAGGVYFVRMSAGRYVATRKIVLMP